MSSGRSIARAINFGRVSVVMIASAAARLLAGDRREAAASIPAPTRSIGNGMPITPVDITRYCPALPPTAPAARRCISRALASPGSPVQALALPALMTTPRIAVELAVSVSRSTRTGAAATWLRVKMPAAEQSRSDMTITRSGLSDCLIPAATAAAVKPWGLVTPPSCNV